MHLRDTDDGTVQLAHSEPATSTTIERSAKRPSLRNPTAAAPTVAQSGPSVFDRFCDSREPPPPGPVSRFTNVTHSENYEMDLEDNLSFAMATIGSHRTQT